MARTLTRLSLAIAIGSALCVLMPMCTGRALAAGLAAKDAAKAKEAKQLYKAGRYEPAAEIFLRLSIDYPDTLAFTRNLGACYYYLRQPEPALSNLREYLRREQGISADDRGEVEGWIAEMEKLREQLAAISSDASAVRAAPVPAAVAPPSSVPQPALPPPAAPSPPVALSMAPPTPEPLAAPPAPPADHPPEPSAPAAAPVLSASPSLADSGKPAIQAEALDLRQKTASENGAATSESGSRWWLWTGIGVVVAGGIVTAIWLSTRNPGRDETCLSGFSGCFVVGK